MLFSSPTYLAVFWVFWGDSLPVKALMEGAGVEVLMDFLLQPPSYYRLEPTYVEEEEDGSLILKELHPTYVDLLMAFYWWCHSLIEGNHVPPTPNGSRLLGLIFSIFWRMFFGRLGMFLPNLPSPLSECSMGLYLRSYQDQQSQSKNPL